MKTTPPTANVEKMKELNKLMNEVLADANLFWKEQGKPKNERTITDEKIKEMEEQVKKLSQLKKELGL